MRTHRDIFIVVFLLFITSSLRAQGWSYDFGDSTGVHDTGVSTTFLPVPSAGTARLRVGTQGGSFSLLNPGDPSLGSVSELACLASTGSSWNKFQLHGFPSGTRATLRFTMCLSGNGGGDWYMFLGKGSSFSGNGGFSTSQVFAGLRWRLDSTGAIETSWRNGTSWDTLTAGAFLRDSVVVVDLYANNTANTESYTYNGQRSLAARCFDLWVNGTRIAGNLAKAGLPDTSSIDSFMFYGGGSSGNGYTLTLDDIGYTNTIPVSPLPVELREFHGAATPQGNLLRWITETEVHSLKFTLQRHDGDGRWKDLREIPAAGSSAVPRYYAWVDTDPHDAGQPCFYRLLLVDRDGSVQRSQVVTVQSLVERTDASIEVYPNPSSGALNLQLSCPGRGVVDVDVLRLDGSIARHLRTEMLDEGTHSISCRLAIERGKYFVTMQQGCHAAATLLLME